MKAIQFKQFGGPEVLQVQQLTDPKPGPGQILVQAKAIGVNPVDTYIRAGSYGDRTFPVTPGFDAAGVVESTGPGVSSFKRGDRVYVAGSLTGAYAEFILCQEAQVHTLPATISFAQGAALGVPYATAYYALFNRGCARPGETLFVHGASGSVGTAAVQMARAHGLRVIGTGGTAKGRERVMQQGAHHALDHGTSDYLDQLMALTQGQGANLIVEMLANVNLAKDLKVLAPRGRVVVVGNRGTVEINPREIMSRNADIRGMSLMYVSEPELAGVHAALVAGLESGTLRPVIGKEIPLDQAVQAHEEVMKPGAHGKIVLIP